MVMENDQKQGQDKNPEANSTHVTGMPPKNANEMEANISAEEMEMLESLETDADGEDADRVYLDNTDADGTRLNEKSGVNSETGDDLDIPGAELDDENEEIGEEDEENNSYSQADTD
jgi:hypothetical protein